MSMVRNLVSIAIAISMVRAFRRVGRPEPPPVIVAAGILRETRGQYWKRIGIEVVLIAALSLAVAAVIDNQRSERELAASERLGWQVTFASSNSFQDTDLSDTDLSGLNLRAFDFSRADFSGSNLMRVAMVDSDLADADLTRVDLTEAVLDGVSLVGSELDGANLEGASLSGTDVSGSDISGVNSMPRLTGLPVCYDADTKWPEGYAPPELDWKSCWSGYDDSTTGDEVRNKPRVFNCEVDDLDRIALDAYAYPTSDNLCAYHGYMQAKLPGDSFDLLFAGASICGALSSEDFEGALSSSFGVGIETSHRRQVLFAATRLLCPEYAAQLPDLIDRVG